MSFSPNKTNPLLLITDGIQIQPYWIVALQFTIQLTILRIFNYCYHKVPWTTLGIYYQREYIINIHESIINEIPANTLSTEQREKRRKHFKLRDRLRKSLEFSIIDTFFAVWVLGHAIWYCVIQKSNGCQSSTSNCYNLFGYRLYNYVFISYSSVFINFVIKLKEFIRHQTFPPYKYMLYKRKIAKYGIVYTRYFHLTITSITIVVGGFLLLPYLITNVLPMAVVYCWFLILHYTSFLTVIVIPSLLSQYIKITVYKSKPLIKIAGTRRPIAEQFFRDMMLLFHPLIIYTIPIILSIFYNYSQYFYYDNNYIELIDIEFNSRDTNVLQSIAKIS